ncbi:DUF922 domain-containing protein [Winogradskyella sp.]|jgi:hypothetical protein|uniref:DUF922 domain-containing protein n=1 Tax=Winogradskyella sp. TaxID=1883156 RepID=UPI0025FBEE5A|nr:DUF922 domain-containing protein [Winogradskyella sp.]MCT4629705.1 DUF922 domain-containing Zn-dependent protease [Winogradskyella sp.]
MQIKHLIITLLFLCFGTSANNEETLTWNNTRKLTWEDFKASPNPNSDAVALTASGITFGYSLKTSGKRIVDFSASVEAHFYPNKSWYLTDRADDYILAHEQLHFDITELYVRKFRQQLDRLVVNQNIKKQMGQIHIAINEALDKTQKTYDKQTNHSINVEAQEYWNNYVKEELNKLDEYKSP